MVRCTDGRVKPSWRMASSIEPMERSSGPLPWLWPVVGLLARSGFREFKGWPRDNKTIRPVWPKPPFSSVDRQESQPALVVLTRPQPQAPNLLGATGTGPPTGRVPLDRWKGQNQAGGRMGPLDRWKGRPDRPLALAGGWACDPLQVPRIQGTASGRQDDRFRPA